jgi:hypothetical protein
METYTLQRFYYEANALIEKYNAKREEYNLCVEFEIKEEEGVPKLSCHASYRKERNYESIAWAVSTTPSLALRYFEEELQKHTGKMLIERVGTEA